MKKVLLFSFFCLWLINNLSSAHPFYSPYSYCACDPINCLDPDGRDYWSTNNINEIKAFWNALGSDATHFDFSNWDHATDAEFTSNLVYNDETHKYYTSYAIIENGEVNVIGKSFDANLTPTIENGNGYIGAFVYQPIDGIIPTMLHYWRGTTYYDGFTNWSVNVQGRITGYSYIAGNAPTGGKSRKLFGGKQKMGHSIGNMTGNRAIQKKQIDAIVKKYNLSKDERRILHDYISHEGLGYNEIDEIIRFLFDK